MVRTFRARTAGKRTDPFAALLEHGHAVISLFRDIKIAGAGIRISGEKRTNQILGTTGWTPLVYEINVEGAAREVELVCELRANKGEVWFDLDSLRIARR